MIETGSVGTRAQGRAACMILDGSRDVLSSPAPRVMAAIGPGLPETADHFGASVFAIRAARFAFHIGADQRCKLRCQLSIR